jgi:hypothetical protein
VIVHVNINPGDGYFMAQADHVGISDEVVEDHKTKERDDVVLKMSSAALRLWHTPVAGSC